MDGHLCERCHGFWSSQAGHDRFERITRFCPLCIPLMYPVRLDPKGPPPPRAKHYRRQGEGLIRRVG